MRGQPLQRADEQEQLPRVLAREWCDGRTSLPQRWRIDDKAFLLESLEGPAHRGAAHAEARGDVRLDDARPGREPPIDDELAQPLVHLLWTRALARFA